MISFIKRLFTKQREALSPESTQEQHDGVYYYRLASPEFYGLAGMSISYGTAVMGIVEDKDAGNYEFLFRSFPIVDRPTSRMCLTIPKGAKLISKEEYLKESNQ